MITPKLGRAPARPNSHPLRSSAISLTVAGLLATADGLPAFATSSAATTLTATGQSVAAMYAPALVAFLAMLLGVAILVTVSLLRRRRPADEEID